MECLAIVVDYKMQLRFALLKPEGSDSILRADVNVECGRMDRALERSKEGLHDLNVIAGNHPLVATRIVGLRADLEQVLRRGLTGASP